MQEVLTLVRCSSESILRRLESIKSLEGVVDGNEIYISNVQWRRLRGLLYSVRHRRIISQKGLTETFCCTESELNSAIISFSVSFPLCCYSLFCKFFGFFKENMLVMYVYVCVRSARAVAVWGTCVKECLCMIQVGVFPRVCACGSAAASGSEWSRVWG